MIQWSYILEFQRVNFRIQLHDQWFLNQAAERPVVAFVVLLLTEILNVLHRTQTDQVLVLNGSFLQFLFAFLEVGVEVLAWAQKVLGGEKWIFGFLGFFWNDFFGNRFVFMFFGRKRGRGVFIKLIFLEFSPDINEYLGFSLEKIGMREDIFGGFFSGLVEAVHIELR